MIIDGKQISAQIRAESKIAVAELAAAGTTPGLAVILVGENPASVSYVTAKERACIETGILSFMIRMPVDITQDKLLDEIRRLNDDPQVHGILVQLPLPKHIDESAVCEALDPAKDMDGVTSGSMAGVFMDSEIGYPPCTAEAVMEILDYYGVELKGKRVTIFGRSLVIGKPAAMMAMRRHATITVCHSRTTAEDFANAGSSAEIVIAALGRARMVGTDKLGEGQVIIDVGINVDDEGKLCGDVDFEQVQEKAACITPVPGGVGSVTTAVLMKHVIAAAAKACGKLDKN